MRIFLLGCMALFVLILVTAAIKTKNPNRQATRRRKLGRALRGGPKLKFEDKIFEGLAEIDDIDVDSALGLDATSEVRVIHKTEEPRVQQASRHYIALHVMAPSGQFFRGYGLLQILLACGLRLDKDKAFHHYAANGKSMFSLLSVNRPGVFDLSNMSNFSYPGLTLFMLVKLEQNAMESFTTMYNTAKRLAEELGGEIYSEDHKPLTTAILQNIRNSIAAPADKAHTPDLFAEIE